MDIALAFAAAIGNSSIAASIAINLRWGQGSINAASIGTRMQASPMVRPNAPRSSSVNVSALFPFRRLVLSLALSAR
jgi:hypothetical protein